MQSKAYTKEIQPKHWAVSLDISHLVSNARIQVAHMSLIVAKKNMKQVQIWHIGLQVKTGNNDAKQNIGAKLATILRMRNNAENILKSQVSLVPSLYSPWNDSTIMCRASHHWNPQHDMPLPSWTGMAKQFRGTIPVGFRPPRSQTESTEPASSYAFTRAHPLNISKHVLCL